MAPGKIQHITKTVKKYFVCMDKKEFVSKLRLFTCENYLHSKVMWDEGRSSLYRTTDLSTTTLQMPVVTPETEAAKNIS